MLRILSTLARVGLGFLLASLTAGLVTVLFVNTPTEIAAQPIGQYAETAGDTLDLALLTATHAAIFAAAFVLIAAGFGEWFSIRSLPFYLLLGCAISLLGLAAQYSSELPGQPTILNNYAVQAFLTAGFFAGFIYWLASGQFAGSAAEGLEHSHAPDAPLVSTDAVTKPPEEREAGIGDEGDDVVIIERPRLASQKRSRIGGRLMERLVSVKERIASARAARTEAATAAAGTAEERGTEPASDEDADGKGSEVPDLEQTQEDRSQRA